MVEMEVVCVGMVEDLAARLTERLDDMETARTTANGLVRVISEQKILTTHVVSSGPDMECLAYTVPNGGIVGFANLFEVIGE